MGLRSGEPGPDGEPVVLLGLLALLACCSALVLKAELGLLFFISSDSSSRKGFLGVAKAGSSRALALVVGSGILLLRS